MISKLSHLFNRKKKFDDYKRIVIFRVDYLGDAVMNTALISAVRSTFPNAEITLVAENFIAELINHDCNIDNTIGVCKKVSITKWLKIIKSLLNNNYDLVLDVTSRWWTIIYGTLSIFKARRYDRDSLMIGGVIKRNYLVYTGHYEREYKREHDVVRALRLIEEFYDINNIPEIYFPLPENNNELFSDISEKYKLSSKNYFIVVPGSQWEVRRWNINKFADAAIEISKRYNLQIVITGIPSEIEICEQLNVLIGADALNLAGKLNINEFISVLNNSKLLIGNDSGPAHVAAGLKIPVVAVMGTADVEVFKPWGDMVRVCYREVLCGPCYSGKCYMPQNLCLQPVIVDEVVGAADELLKLYKSK
ncbi:MAG: glycosyltransferase family 9 protein [candidate division Zixibacteria bacterium]|nr:glycosyltransferase family 9 protein [candidate division Zixibacteria bacterium]